MFRDRHEFVALVEDGVRIGFLIFAFSTFFELLFLLSVQTLMLLSHLFPSGYCISHRQIQAQATRQFFFSRVRFEHSPTAVELLDQSAGIQFSVDVSLSQPHSSSSSAEEWNLAVPGLMDFQSFRVVWGSSNLGLRGNIPSTITGTGSFPDSESRWFQTVVISRLIT